jgi:hypothetical protein
MGKTCLRFLDDFFILLFLDLFSLDFYKSVEKICLAPRPLKYTFRGTPTMRC